MNKEELKLAADMMALAVEVATVKAERDLLKKERDDWKEIAMRLSQGKTASSEK